MVHFEARKTEGKGKIWHTYVASEHAFYCGRFSFEVFFSFVRASDNIFFFFFADLMSSSALGLFVSIIIAYPFSFTVPKNGRPT